MEVSRNTSALPLLQKSLDKVEEMLQNVADSEDEMKELTKTDIRTEEPSLSKRTEPDDQQEAVDVKKDEREEEEGEANRRRNGDEETEEEELVQNNLESQISAKFSVKL